MREILFRGKRMDNGEWVYGNYGFNDTFTAENHYIFQNKAWEFFVDPATVGQYTGLTDKNGKKIFEGDILRITWSVTGRKPVHELHSVVYSKSGFFTKKDGVLKGQVSNYACSNCKGLTVEIIGNIHDNPELLKGA